MHDLQEREMSGLARRLPALWRGGMANGSSDQSLSAVELGEAGSSAGPRDIAQASSAGELGDTEEQPPLQSFLGLFLAGAPGSPEASEGDSGEDDAAVDPEVGEGAQEASDPQSEVI
jgi:hypothetical protein